MADPRTLITAADMDRMSAQERADAVDATTVRSWDDLPDGFRAKVLDAARQLSEQRNGRA